MTSDQQEEGTVLMLLWGAGAALADDAGAETFVALRVNGPRGNVLLQDELPLPVDRVLVAPDGKHSLGVYVKPTEDGGAIVELVAGKEKDGRPLPKVQQSFSLTHFAPHLEDLLYKKSKWSVEAILGQSWDAPPVTDATSEPVRYVLAWDDAKLLREAPEIEAPAPAEGAAPAPAPKPKPKPKPKPGQPVVENVVVERPLEGGRTDVAAQASPMKVLGPHGTKFVHAETVLTPDPAWHCAIGGPPPAGPDPAAPAAVQPFYVGLGDLVPRMTSREVVGQFDDGTGYRVAAGVALVPEGEGTGKYRVSTGGLSFVISATEDDVAFYYRPSTHFAPAADRPMSLAAGAVGTTQLGEVTWSGDGGLPIQGMRGIAAPLATVRVPCAEVRLRPDLAKIQP